MGKYVLAFRGERAPDQLALYAALTTAPPHCRSSRTACTGSRWRRCSLSTSARPMTPNRPSPLSAPSSRTRRPTRPAQCPTCGSSRVVDPVLAGPSEADHRPGGPQQAVR
jgi:hypothetical protein